MKGKLYGKSDNSQTQHPGGGLRLPDDVTALVGIFTASISWTVPQTGKYRVTVIGRGGDGGTASTGTYYYAAAGGGAGGACQSVLELTKGTVILITVNTAQSSFGSYLSAIAGGSAPDVGSDAGNRLSPGIGGTSSGGNIYNYKGDDGTSGTGTGGLSTYNSGRGGGYSSNANAYLTDGGGTSTSSDGMPPLSPTQAGFFPYGGGASGGGIYRVTTSSGNSGYRGKGGNGASGAVIVEKVLE